MLQSINRDNYADVLNKFATADLENMVQKYPYFHQAHLLLAKKYQLEKNPKFDQQLQTAALYAQDRELFYHIFTQDSTATWPSEPDWNIAVSLHEETFEVESDAKLEIAEEVAVVDEIKEEEIITTEPTTEIIAPETAPAEEAEAVMNAPVHEEVESVPVVEQEISGPIEPALVEEVKTEIIATPVDIIPEEATVEVFSTDTPHTFEEWLKAFAPKQEETSLATTEVETPEEPETEELDEIISTGISADYVHGLVEEETQYSKGLEEYIKEQINKRKKPEFTTPLSESVMDVSIITETMAKVYEMQKKYAKALQAYELLSLKYPEKSDLFAARINYLKNLI